MTYEYVCEACGHQWEAEQSIKENPLKSCVSCGVEKAKRLISGGTGFLLKGGGWYADLYGSPGSSKADDKGAKSTAANAKSETATSESAGSKSEGASSGDTKPAASNAASSAAASSPSTSTSTSAAS